MRRGEIAGSTVVPDVSYVCRSELARDESIDNAGYQMRCVIVEVLREQARSYSQRPILVFVSKPQRLNTM
ncbi:hypothetical protein D3C81_909030 [compost metagenome]